MGIPGSTNNVLQCSFGAGTYFQIALDSANFHEGSLCTGSVKFELTSNQPALEVYIAIHGHETVMWKERRRVESRHGFGVHRSGYGHSRRHHGGMGHHHNRAQYRTVIVHDTVQSVNQRFMVMKINQSLTPGEYTYPFSFQLPTNLPGTYVHSSGFGTNQMSCSCTYTLYCELLNGFSMVGRTMCPIVIMQQPRSQIMYDVPCEITKAVKTWCCCSKGTVNIKALFEKDKVRMNETVAMRFTADNTNCKLDIRSMN